MYCTYLTVYSGNKMPPFYIGYVRLSRIAKGYHGSVSSKKYRDIWNSELSEHPHLFKTHIISTHQTKLEAFEKEKFFHVKLNVLGEMYINESISHGSFVVLNRTKEHTAKIADSRRGTPHSEETKRKISESKTGKCINRTTPVSEETKNTISKKLTGRSLSEETKLKMSQSKIGSKHTEDSKARMRKPKSESAKANMKKSTNLRAAGKMWITDGTNNKMIDNTTQIPDGWYKGRS